MDKKIAGLLGAAAALTSMNAANAATQAPTESFRAASYADLLNPVPNAVAALVADDANRSNSPAAEELNGVKVAQSHHHHHHHRYHRRVIIIPRRHRHHHHHHHHHHQHHSQYMAIPKAPA